MEKPLSPEQVHKKRIKTLLKATYQDSLPPEHRAHANKLTGVLTQLSTEFANLHEWPKSLEPRTEESYEVFGLNAQKELVHGHISQEVVGTSPEAFLNKIENILNPPETTKEEDVKAMLDEHGHKIHDAFRENPNENHPTKEDLMARMFEEKNELKDT